MSLFSFVARRVTPAPQQPAADHDHALIAAYLQYQLALLLTEPTPAPAPPVVLVTCHVCHDKGCAFCPAPERPRLTAFERGQALCPRCQRAAYGPWGCTAGC